MEKTLEYYKQNAEEDYKTTPISVLRYISELEEAVAVKSTFKELITQRINQVSFGIISTDKAIEDIMNM
jgi:hypothetical protein